MLVGVSGATITPIATLAVAHDGIPWTCRWLRSGALTPFELVAHESIGQADE
jgi:hypothetical protein